MMQDAVSRELRAELGRRDLSRDQFAKIIGWEPTKLHRRLKGRVAWTVDDVELIAGALDIPRSQLLNPTAPYQRAAS